ncbi:iron-containing alcohol dehydrogenase [Biomaibacter acetigenes]|uniref:Iron-containing alcohol dehydrogenase n=1 Tax=Biomaibacter acetigenes TaxID=2316383 RepID=A0A3G2R242_9FIRM|nr:iron-containing alcohol dehydrogenase family protein [Biomaibacter acetigenes]AYO29371.1 iron-containing alcohol dehydrogenase [Biomaibacter acetigenes]
MHLVMASPNRYIQEPGILKTAGEHIAPIGRKVLLVGDNTTLSVVEPDLYESLDRTGLEYKKEVFGGEVTDAETQRIAKLAEDESFDVIAGVGGGKAIDTAKAAAAFSNRPLVTIPTIAATCAAWTPLSVFYNEEGAFIRYTVFQNSPRLTLADTRIIAEAPVRYFNAGIADTVVKWYEAEASSANKNKNIPTVAGLSMARLCAETLFEYGIQASHDVEQKKPTEAVQKCIDAIIALSGMVGGLGSDNCRIAAAHAIHNGFCVLEKTHHLFHGEKVAFATIVQLTMEKRSEDEINKLIDFLKGIHQPVTLEDMCEGGFTGEELTRVAEASCVPEESIHNMPFTVTPDMVKDAILEADRLGMGRK